MFSATVEELIALALREDIGEGDITSIATIPFDQTGVAEVIAKQDLLFCSHAFLSYLCAQSNLEVQYQPLSKEGDTCTEGTVLGRLYGPVRGLLSLERTALNFVQRLSGISTRTFALTQQVGSAGIQLLDTRKTTPGWRELEKYAVAYAGGSNHRQGLFDAFLIKNNHIDALGGDIAEAIRRCRAYKPECQLEVEVRSQEELQQALLESPDWILLDNMSANEIDAAVALVDTQQNGRSKPKLEVSGGITPETVSNYLRPGIDAISMGWLTHSAPAVDISLRYVKAETA